MTNKITIDSDVDEARAIRYKISELLESILKREFPIGTRFKSYLVDRRTLPEGLDWVFQIVDYNTEECFYSMTGDFSLKNLLSRCYILHKALDSLGRPNGKEDSILVDNFLKYSYEVE